MDNGYEELHESQVENGQQMKVDNLNIASEVNQYKRNKPATKTEISEYAGDSNIASMLNFVKNKTKEVLDKYYKNVRRSSITL
jgi:hypothetical protein